MEGDLTKAQRLWSATLVSVSLVIFVSWEIFRMFGDNLRAMKASIKDVGWRESVSMIVWFIQFVLALLTAMGAIGVMFSAFVQELLNLYRDNSIG